MTIDGVPAYLSPLYSFTCFHATNPAVLRSPRTKNANIRCHPNPVKGPVQSSVSRDIASWEEGRFLPEKCDGGILAKSGVAYRAAHGLRSMQDTVSGIMSKGQGAPSTS